LGLLLFLEGRCFSLAGMNVRFAYRRYRLPLRHAVRTAHGIWSEREGVYVRLENEAGKSGIGEAAPIAWFGTETIDEVAEACARLDEWGDDSRFDDLPSKFACLHNAIAAARHELKSAAAQMDKSQNDANGIDALSGTQVVGESNSYLSVAALLPAGRAAIAEIPVKSDAGFRIFKWKVGVADLADELSLLDDVCAELPDGAKLRLDANGAWERRQAQRWLERCADRPVEFVEQPIAANARGAEDSLRGLAEDFPTPIALDESLVTGGDIERWIGGGWRGVYVIKPSLIADLPAAIRKLAAAKADVVFSSALETGVGARAALQAAFAWTGEARAVGFGVWPLFVDRRFDGPHLTPFLRRQDVERINPEEMWNALS
jgi:O-succinylbenzoate synthase